MPSEYFARSCARAARSLTGVASRACEIVPRLSEFRSRRGAKKIAVVSGKPGTTAWRREDV